MSAEHPVQQPISDIDILFDGRDLHCFRVGHAGVTRIEATTKPGLHCDIPYVRVWAGERCAGEFCQHNIVGVYFGEVETSDTVTIQDEAELEALRCKKLDIVNIVNGSCTTCGKPEIDCGCLPF